jgi:nucleoside-diphosphate-sugar epimerase
VDELLARGHSVACLVRRPELAVELQKRPVRIIQGDVRHTDCLVKGIKGSDGVFHLAGRVKALKHTTMFDTNVVGTRNVVSACANQATPPTLVVISSLAAAGPSTRERPLRESDPCQPVSVYGKTKRGGELAAAEKADRVPTTIVRPPIVFGSRDQGMLSVFKPINRTRVHMLPGYRRNVYSLIHAKDLSQALLLVAEKGERVDPADFEMNSFRQGCYYAACAEQLTYAELGTLVSRSLDRDFVLNVPVPKWSVWLTAGVNQGVSKVRGEPHVFSIDKAREATAGSWTCSSEKIKSELGFEPHASLDDRMREAATWYREQQLL